MHYWFYEDFLGFQQVPWIYMTTDHFSLDSTDLETFFSQCYWCYHTFAFCLNKKRNIVAVCSSKRCSLTSLLFCQCFLDILNREDVDVRFPKHSVRSDLPDNYYELENQMKQKKWERERILEDMRREQALLDIEKYNFSVRKQDLIKLLADSSSYITQVVLSVDCLWNWHLWLFTGIYIGLSAPLCSFPITKKQISAQGKGAGGILFFTGGG